MTLTQAIAKISNRCRIDLNSEVDTTNNDAMTTAVMDAAREVSRDTYFLYTDHAALTLATCVDGSSAGAIIDLLDLTQCAFPIFDCRGIFINKAWLRKKNSQAFKVDYWSYYTDAATSNPDVYTLIPPSKARLYPPPNATASASSAFAIGFYLHPNYSYNGVVDNLTVFGNKDSELQGPKEFHDLIVNKCSMNITEAFLSGDNAKTRFANLMAHYNAKTAEYSAFNQAEYQDDPPTGAIGNTRRIASLA